jgi:hypothetical protein
VVPVVRRLGGVAGHVLEGSGFPVHWLPALTAWGAPDANEVRTALGCRLLIDQVANRALSAGALLDQDWAPAPRVNHRGRLTREPNAWPTGPRYAPLSAVCREAPR